MSIGPSILFAVMFVFCAVVVVLTGSALMRIWFESRGTYLKEMLEKFVVRKQADEEKEEK